MITNSIKFIEWLLDELDIPHKNKALLRVKIDAPFDDNVVIEITYLARNVFGKKKEKQKSFKVIPNE